MANEQQRTTSPDQEAAEKQAEFTQFHLSEPAPVWERPPQAGDTCPRCGEARLDYNGLLNLVCPACDFILAGCFT